MNLDTEHLMPIEYAIVMVNDKPSCIWEYGHIPDLTIQFVEEINPSYFEYQAKTNLKYLQIKKYKQSAALSIRNAYSHGLETLFSLICAFIQSPYCVPGWLLLSNNRSLCECVRKINEHQKIPNALKTELLDWDYIAHAVFNNLEISNREEREILIENFGRLWKKLSFDFINDSSRKEYNSFKHGFRIKPGGFGLSIGPHSENGNPTSTEEMQKLGDSEFGSSYFDFEQVKNSKNHYFLKRSARNWDPEDMVWGLNFISISISNIISALKVYNGVNPTKVRFAWPNDINLFHEPWLRTKNLGVLSISGFSYIVGEEVIEKFDDNKLLDLYLKGKFIQKRVIRFSGIE